LGCVRSFSPAVRRFPKFPRQQPEISPMRDCSAQRERRSLGYETHAPPAKGNRRRRRTPASAPFASCFLQSQIENLKSKIDLPMWRNGRRNGLKIRSRESEVWVRIPPSAPFEKAVFAIALPEPPLLHACVAVPLNLLDLARSYIDLKRAIESNSTLPVFLRNAVMP
jgi:hypothetical protein